MKVFKNLMGDGSKIHGDTIIVGGENNHKTVNELNDDFESHKADNVTYYTETSRDLSVAGTQVISGLPFVPELLIIDGLVDGSLKSCAGRVSLAKQSHIAYNPGGNNYLFRDTYGLAFYNSGSDITRAIVTINPDKTLSIGWTKAGNGATGTATIRIMAFAHGG